MEEITFIEDRYTTALKKTIEYCKDLNKKKEIRNDVIYNSDNVLNDMLQTGSINQSTYTGLKEIIDNPDKEYKLIVKNK